jgi:hypothetical protein
MKVFLLIISIAFMLGLVSCINNVDDTWVEVTGTLEEFFVEDADSYFMRLSAISIYER